MKILLSSHFFHPSVGGIEQVSMTLAREFAKAGHIVKVVTTTRCATDVEFPFEVIRHPVPSRLLDLVRWCDVYFQNNISLQSAWPLLFVKKPWVVAHHTWIKRVDGTRAIRDWLKQYVIKYATNISVSGAVAKHLARPSVVIGNPYRDEVFKREPAIPRTRELVFLGRLVWDKGVDLLLAALGLLKQRGVFPRLTVIGDGPEFGRLSDQIDRLELRGQVEVIGKRTDDELVELLNRHKIMVVPSRWQEPFGLVALEGMACGCVVLGADCGGLPDAIGAGGTTFECGNIRDMADQIESLLQNEAVLEHYRSRARDHLAKHAASVVAKRYLEVIDGAAR